MGVGFCVVVNEKDADKVIRIFSKHGTNSRKIGHVEEEPGVKIKDFSLSY
jgi:phosphoribosylaminoimidazole (AIR) synthetase